MKKSIIAALLSISAIADPMFDALELRASTGNQFAASGQTCANAILFTGIGPITIGSLRTCYGVLFSRADIELVVSSNAWWSFSTRADNFDLIRPAKLSSGTQGYYIVNYTRTGMASEITAILDSPI